MTARSQNPAKKFIKRDSSALIASRKDLNNLEVQVMKNGSEFSKTHITTRVNRPQIGFNLRQIQKLKQQTTKRLSRQN